MCTVQTPTFYYNLLWEYQALFQMHSETIVLFVYLSIIQQLNIACWRDQFETMEIPSL